MEAFSPHEPLIRTLDLPGVGGQIGRDPDDFMVDEIALFAPAASGEHWYVRVKKRLLTTPELLTRIARAARVKERELGCAGMKDKHAVTTQWISVPASAVAPEHWPLPDGVEILEVTRHTRKLKTGQQQGNRFRIRLAGVTVDARDRAEAILKALEARGLPNYFGPQRFGYQGQNLARALAWLKQSSPEPRGNSRFLRKLYPSVIQSEVFNRYVTRRLNGSAPRLFSGEVVRLHGSSAVFVVEDVARELPRLEQGDIHLTGPMVGPKMKAPQGEPHELEEAIVRELELNGAELDRLGEWAAGTRRDLLIKPEDGRVSWLDEGSLQLQFTLPSGSYATQLIRELTRGPFDASRAVGDA